MLNAPLLTALCAQGNNANSQLGDGLAVNKNVPTPITMSWALWVAVALGDLHSCAIRQDGLLFCWVGSPVHAGPPRLQVLALSANTPRPALPQGNNANSQLGDGSATTRSSPVQVGSASNWAVIGASTSRTCGIKAGGDLLCWGYNNVGQLGDASITTRTVPTAVASTGTWASLAMSAVATCGVPGAAPGSIRLVSAPPAPPMPPPAPFSAGNCWGTNSKGQWGDGTILGARFAPSAIPSPWLQLSLSENSACGIKASSALSCWGTDVTGSLGDGTSTSRFSPTPVSGGGQWIAVFAASAHVSWARPVLLVMGRLLVCHPGAHWGVMLRAGMWHHGQLEPVLLG